MSILQERATTANKPFAAEKSQNIILKRVLVALAVIIFVGLALYNLDTYPAPWFDEGEHLRVSKTLVQYGQYAVWSADGFRYFGPTIGVGPTVLLPVALSFKLFGIGLEQARLVIVLYLFIAAVLYWFYGQKLLRSGLVTGLGFLLLCAAPGIAFIETGRQGLGEIPAFVFMLAGLFFWDKTVSAEKNAIRYVWLVGLCWALAAITKSTYGLLLPPVVVVAYLVNRFYYKRVGLGWQVFAIPLLFTMGGLGCWYLAVLLFLGGGNFWSNLELLRTASGGSAFVFSPSRIASALKFLIGPEGLFGLAVPGLLYGCWLARRRSAEALRLVMPLSLCLVWFGWFGFASIGWPRYSFPALALVTLFSAKFLLDLPQLLAKLFGKTSVKQISAVVIGLLIAAITIGNLIGFATKISQPDTSAESLAAYMQKNIKPDALVETWESELGFLSDLRFHYPPPEMLDKAVRLKWLNKGGPSLPELYHPELLQPDYLVIGAFARWNDLYPQSLITEKYRLVITFGSYTLYERLK